MSAEETDQEKFCEEAAEELRKLLRKKDPSRYYVKYIRNKNGCVALLVEGYNLDEREKSVPLSHAGRNGVKYDVWTYSIGDYADR